MNAQSLESPNRTVSGLHFGSLEKKCHSNASATKRHKEYYMGEGGGFPRVRAVMCQVSPRLPVATLALGLRPRQRGYKGAGQEEAGSQITYSQECKECEGMSPHTPK
jgi:hypothetical protein